ncbi:hypothetical protein Tco_0653797 [Tanacetum coccineum]|uniref:Uncharacterized protein n=1 Tax=Tanacetum coccineum TaxID=301880 RepID=A0ABQ4X1R6_9ASTR
MDLASYGVGCKRDDDSFGWLGTVNEGESDGESEQGCWGHAAIQTQLQHTLIVESIHINFDDLKEVMALVHNSPGLAPQRKMTFEHNSSELKIQDHNNEPSNSKMVPNVSPPADTTDQSLQDLDLLFSPMYEEYFTTGNQSVLKSFALFDNSQQHDTQPTLNFQPTLELIIPQTNVNAEENNTNQAENAPFEAY